VSFVKDALFGTRGSPSQVVNTTPQAFQGMAGPLAQQLMQLMRSPQQFQGPLAAPMGQGEQQALSGVNAAAQQAGMLGPGQQMLMGSAGFNPFAQLTGLEQFGVGQVAGQAFGQNPMMPGNMQAIQQAGFGYNPLSNTVNQQLQTIAGGGPNPMVDQLIQSATRPIIEQFGDDQLAQRGAFTAAGHQVQGRGSSPFAQASARLATGAMNAVGDVGTQIAAQEQQRQMQALQLGMQQPGMQLQNMMGAAGFGDQLQNNALARALQGLDAAGTGQERQGAAFENQQNRQMQAGGALGQQQLAGQMAQLEAQMQNLQAQGLPRMIQQLGIDAGLAQFQQQQQQLLQLMQLMGGLASPNAAVLPGTAGTPGALQGFASGFGGSLGNMIGSRMFQ
jgi:hypothetical protein